MQELILAWPSDHSLKVLGKYFAPAEAGINGAALNQFETREALMTWITELGWIPDIIWLNCLQELRLGDELSQQIIPERKIKLAANIRVLRSALSNDELNRLIRVDQLICASAYGAQVWVDTYGFDVAIIPNSVNCEKFAPQPKVITDAIRASLGLNQGEDRLLLYLGRCVECKGINDLPYILDASQAIRPDLNYHLAIVGRDKTLPQSFKTLLHNRGRHNISIHNFTDNPVPWLAAADVLLVPSRWDELFGKVIVEALATGCPVLASNRGGIPEILTGRLSNFLMNAPCQPKQWGTAIAELETVPANFKKEIRQYAQQFSASTLAQAYVQLFNTLLQ